jgi:hypothetical protein
LDGFCIRYAEDCEPDRLDGTSAKTAAVSAQREEGWQFRLRKCGTRFAPAALPRGARERKGPCARKKAWAFKGTSMAGAAKTGVKKPIRHAGLGKKAFLHFP